LTADGWFPTRDNGYLDEAGFLHVLGRADDTIIRGGENIAPSEIEAVLMTHPGVLECAVVGLPDPEWGQVIGAFIVPEPSSSPTAEDLQAFARERLRSSKTPSEIVFLTELPTTDTGKVLRRKLVEHHPRTVAAR
jgi:acyl-CoA synthetase (AMP-forming)/AMP-acid ligase II